MPIQVTKEQQFARLASEARAVLTGPQVEEIAESMDLTRVEVEDLFHDAEEVYEIIKDRIVEGRRLDASRAARQDELEANDFYVTRPIFVPKPGAQSLTLKAVVPGSAIIGFYAEPTAQGERVQIYYEGNLHGAVNLKTFAQRCMSAHGRGAVKYPTVATAMVNYSDLILIGQWHPRERVVALKSLEALANWCGLTLPISSRELNGNLY